MGMKFYWGHLELVDGEGCELTKPQAIEALREFKTTGGISGVFAYYHGQELEDPNQVDWEGFPEDLTAEEIEELGQLAERSEDGRHFTQVHAPEFLEKLERGGYINIYRPTHETTGIPYGQEEWHLSITIKTENLF
jgi:hypothetical protein